MPRFLVARRRPEPLAGSSPANLAAWPPLQVGGVLVLVLAGILFTRLPALGQGTDCDNPAPEWLACEDFEGGARGWADWFADSPWVECLGCRDGVNNPDRIALVEDEAAAKSGAWRLYMPAEAAAQYQGAALSFRTCDGVKRPGCRLTGYDEMYFRTWVRLDDDHGYVHHFLSIDGTRPQGYWDADGNAGCRPNGSRWAGTTLDFNEHNELFFYTYFPGMRCDQGNYCTGDFVDRICRLCATKEMPCARPECCWGNGFRPDPAVVLPRGEWVCLEIGMGLNTPGEADGWMAFWLNGELAHEERGRHWRDVPELQLNKAWLQHYIEVGDASRSHRISFDDVVVSTARIGCGAEAPAPTLAPEEPTPTNPPGSHRVFLANLLVSGR